MLEREAACDDWAVRQTGAPEEYAACLASLAQSLKRSRSPVATPSALGSGHALVARIERLASASHPITLNYYVIGETVMLFVILTLAVEAFSPALAFIPPGSISAGRHAAAGLVAAACSNPNALAQYIDGPAPVLPHGVKVKGSATVLVAIAPSGSVVTGSVWKTSGNAAIDRAVLEAAQHSKYSPPLINCEPVGGTYPFHAEFTPNGP